MKTIAYLTLFLTLLSGSLVQADEALKRGLAKAQYMLRQANSEKIAIEASLKEARAEIDALKAEMGELQSGLKKADKRIAKLKDNNGEWQEEYGNLKNTLAETRMQLAKARRYGEIQDERFAMQTENFKLCRANNIKLYEVNQELVGAYQDKSAMDAIKQRDPFFGLKRVEVENLVQDYQYRIEDLNMEMNSHLFKETGEAPKELKVGHKSDSGAVNSEEG